MDQNINYFKETAAFLSTKGISEPEVAIVLGTGLGALVDHIEVEKEINYEDIPHFPVATVEFHKGKLVYGKLAGKRVLAMVGRFHYYEGYSMQQIVFPIRVFRLLGVKQLILSNAAGGINSKFEKSDLMLITDHINLLGSNPLTGPNLDEFGVRFPDMSEPYSRSLNGSLEKIADQLNIPLKKGVYVSVPGPNLETAAEYKMLSILGADAVGMSTVPEVIAAKHCGMSVVAISVITDLCDYNNLEPVDIADIIAAAQKGEKNLIRLIAELLKEIQ